MTIRSTSALGRVLQALIAVSALAAVITNAWLYTRLRDGTFVLHLPDRNGPPEPAYWTGTGMSGSAIWYLPGTVMLAAEIVWLFWQHRATENLWARGYGGLRVRPGWSVGWWFIPIANLFMPCIAMLELDRRSTADGVPRRASPIVGAWWAAWIVYSIVPAVGFVLAAVPPFSDVAQRIDERTTVLDLSEVAHAVAPWLIVLAILLALAGALAIAVVRRIDAAQDAMLETPGAWLVPVPMRPDAIL